MGMLRNSLCWRMMRATSTPVQLGMYMSIRIRSGLNCLSAFSVWRGSLTISDTIWFSCSVRRIRWLAVLESSTISTRYAFQQAAVAAAAQCLLQLLEVGPYAEADQLPHSESLS